MTPEKPQGSTPASAGLSLVPTLKSLADYTPPPEILEAVRRYHAEFAKDSSDKPNTGSLLVDLRKPPHSV